MSTRTFAVFGLSALAMAGLAQVPALAGAQLITNGDFAQTSSSTSTQVNTTNVTGWSVNGGYTFIYLPGAGTSGTTADTTGASGQYGTVSLWGPGDGSANGLTQSPTGNNFIAQDDNFQQGAITQTVGGLSVGTSYLLSFYWAGAQQAGFTGVTQENWVVNFGNQTYTTPTVNTASEGFTPWTKVSYTFTASATSQVLSFLASGTPGGAPPFSLLDGVSLVAAPEPATWAILLAGVAGAGFVVRRRRASSRPAAFA